MRKKIVTIIFLILCIIQAMVPLKVNAEPVEDGTTAEETTPTTPTTPTNSKTSFFSPDITWEWEYKENQYGLFIPSNADTIENAPMIVWLHGNGGDKMISGGESYLFNEAVPSLFRNWKMEGFSAFILCPQSRASWQNPSISSLKKVIDEVLQEYPIDPSNVVISGHSAGGVGAQTVAVNMTEYFSKGVIFAGHAGGANRAASIPIKCYAGSRDKTYSMYLEQMFKRLYGSENCYILDGYGHTDVIKAAFYEDTGEKFGIAGNNRSDLVEWLFDDANVSESEFVDIVSPTTGLNAITGIILEPTVEFFTFIVDSIMSVLSGIMTQEDIKFVMVEKDEIGSIASIGGIGASYSIPSMEAYETYSGKLDKLKYPRFTYSAEELFAGDIDLVDANFIDHSNDNPEWLDIRQVISQWYQILRMIAIVGLLSVLIYTGIKTIISSSTKDKAKYKELLTSWLMGVVLVFSMHYIMAFILAIIEEITGLLHGLTGAIQVNAGEVSFTTNLIGLARFQIQQQHFTAKVGYLVIYVALVVYTFKFTWVYLKRVLKMAFLTLIAPIVALTYPIDKANDGKAQGFDMWLKEYIFNALLQPMHYILYYLLVSTSLQLAVTNPIYAIVALAFMTQAEKLLKKIFGFGKAKAGTVGGLAGAFATGAITSSLIDHVRDPLHPLSPGKGSKGAKKSSGGKSSLDNYYSDEGIHFYDDTTSEDDLLNMNLRGGASSYDSGSFSRTSSSENRGTEYDSWSFDRSTSREDMLEILDQYQDYGGYLGDVPDLDLLDDDELGDLIQDRVIDNGGSIKNNIFIPLNVNERPEETVEKSEWSKFKDEHPSVRGVENVMKSLVKPVWDTEKDFKYNSKKVAANVVKGAVGASVGVAAAAVQAGISITDGKYSPIEGIGTVAAGVAGVSAIGKNVENKKELDPEDKKAVEKYSQQWFNRDDIINKYNQEFPGEGKKRRNRAARNYVTRGITDVKDQKQAMKFADLIQKERGLDEEEADKIAVATLQYRQGLTSNGNYNILFDKKQRNKYIDVKVDTYTGSASKDAVRRLHDDLIENVRDFDRANR